MSYNVVATGKFEKGIKRLIKKFPSLKSEYASLVTHLKENPQTGTPVKARVKAVAQGL